MTTPKQIIADHSFPVGNAKDGSPELTAHLTVTASNNTIDKYEIIIVRLLNFASFCSKITLENA